MYLKYWELNNLYEWAMLQTLPVNSFEWVQDISEFNEDLINTIMKKVMKNIFTKLIFNILKNYLTFTMVYIFAWKNENLKSQKAFYYMIKLIVLFTQAI